MVTWNYISDSIQGTERKENKDRVWIKEDDTSLFAVLFDGISSAKDANKGIDVAIEFLEKAYSEIQSKKNFRVSDLIYEVNQRIADANLSSPFTTCSAAYVLKASGDAQFSNLGDSRIYQITRQYIKQLSEDDNLIHNKNIVTKYLGMVNLDREQVTDFTLNVSGSRILLCSDGFYSLLEENLERFYKILNFKRTASIQKSFRTEIAGENLDDASYLLILN